MPFPIDYSTQTAPKRLPDPSLPIALRLFASSIPEATSLPVTDPSHRDIPALHESSQNDYSGPSWSFNTTRRVYAG